jgi:hypothetical protein
MEAWLQLYNGGLIIAVLQDTTTPSGTMIRLPNVLLGLKTESDPRVLVVSRCFRQLGCVEFENIHRVQVPDLLEKETKELGKRIVASGISPCLVDKIIQCGYRRPEVFKAILDTSTDLRPSTVINAMEELTAGGTRS